MNRPQDVDRDLRALIWRIEELKETLEHERRELKHTRELLNVAIKSKRVAMALSD